MNKNDKFLNGIAPELNDDALESVSGGIDTGIDTDPNDIETNNMN